MCVCVCVPISTAGSLCPTTFAAPDNTIHTNAEFGSFSLDTLSLQCVYVLIEAISVLSVYGTAQ